MATRSAAVKAEKESKIEKASPKAEATPKEKAPRKPTASKFSAKQFVTLLVDYNPKRPSSASFKRFDLYEDGMTVEDALKAGIWAGDLNWDTAHGFVKIADEFDEDAEKKSKPAPKAKVAKAEKKPAKKAKPKEEEEEEEETEE